MNPIELVTTIIQSIVNYPENVLVERTVDNLGVLLTVKANKEDIGLIVGREGQNIKAIRWIAKICGKKHKENVNIKVSDPLR